MLSPLERCRDVNVISPRSTFLNCVVLSKRLLERRHMKNQTRMEGETLEGDKGNKTRRPAPKACENRHFHRYLKPLLRNSWRGRHDDT